MKNKENGADAAMSFKSNFKDDEERYRDVNIIYS